MFRRLLITNDDGIDAPGLSALETACAELADEIMVVAPRDQASQIGHRVTTYEPLGVTVYQEGTRYAVHGTPADCVRIALKALMPDRAPDLVVSGINYGGNLGVHDVYISGTVAAAREAVLHGIPAIAVSNYHRSDLEFSWETSASRTRQTLETLLNEEPLGEGELWNINLPHPPPGAPPPEIRYCELERTPLEVAFEQAIDFDDGSDAHHHFRYSGRYQERGHNGESDVAVCFGGDIAVTRLRV